MTGLRIGHGYDVHRLTEGRRLILGGVEVPYEKGLLGHSDADVLTHAVMDALLGAAALGDIGKLFPDTDPAFKGADSRELLREAWRRDGACGCAGDAGAGRCRAGRDGRRESRAGPPWGAWPCHAGSGHGAACP